MKLKVVSFVDLKQVRRQTGREHSDKPTRPAALSSHPTGLHGPARVRLHEGRGVFGDAEGDVGDDQDLGSAETGLPAHLHRHVRHSGQHAAAVQAAHQAVALL